jgi:hypothetical protein
MATLQSSPLAVPVLVYRRRSKRGFTDAGGLSLSPHVPIFVIRKGSHQLRRDRRCGNPAAISSLLSGVGGNLSVLKGT